MEALKIEFYVYGMPQLRVSNRLRLFKIQIRILNTQYRNYHVELVIPNQIII